MSETFRNGPNAVNVRKEIDASIVVDFHRCAICNDNMLRISKKDYVIRIKSKEGIKAMIIFLRKVYKLWKE